MTGDGDGVFEVVLVLVVVVVVVVLGVVLGAVVGSRELNVAVLEATDAEEGV